MIKAPVLHNMQGNFTQCIYPAVNEESTYTSTIVLGGTKFAESILLCALSAKINLTSPLSTWLQTVCYIATSQYAHYVRHTSSNTCTETGTCGMPEVGLIFGVCQESCVQWSMEDWTCYTYHLLTGNTSNDAHAVNVRCHFSLMVSTFCACGRILSWVHSWPLPRVTYLQHTTHLPETTSRKTATLLMLTLIASLSFTYS